MAIYYHNFWPQDPEKVWFTYFLEYYKLTKKDIHFCSVYDKRQYLNNVPHPRIYFSGENVHSHPLMPQLAIEYKNHCIDVMDLSMGYDELEADNYFRFPLWILYFTAVKERFLPFSKFNYIKQAVDFQNNINNRVNIRKKFAAQISRHDANGIRAYLVNALNQLETVECAGRCLNNTDELQTKYQDDKIEYLRQFRFNICPENASEIGYVTEKPFEAIQAGCIPIYWGNRDLPPEPEVLNLNALIQLKLDNPQPAFELISELYNSPAAYHEFIEQKPFKPEAAEWIWEKLSEFKIRLKEILRQY